MGGLKTLGSSGGPEKQSDVWGLTSGSQWSQMAISNPLSLPVTGKDTSIALHVGLEYVRNCSGKFTGFSSFNPDLELGVYFRGRVLP